MSVAGLVPLWLKITYSVFVAVLVPVYWRAWGPANFLWFCDVALFVTLVGLWLESPLLISMQAVGIVLLQVTWIADFVWRLISGRSLTGVAEYMFDTSHPLGSRALSLFHGWLPILLVWLVIRLGYDRRALVGQVLLACVVLVASYLAVPGPEGPAGNINKVFGPNDKTPQSFIHPALWVMALMLLYSVCAYLPSHFVFRWLIPPPKG